MKQALVVSSVLCGSPLHAKGWSSVLAQERLRSDQIHANAAGYAEFAQGLVGTLRQTGLLAQ